MRQIIRLFTMNAKAPMNMNNTRNIVSSTAIIAALITSASFLPAADVDLRIIPQVAVGTAGFEPGLALEWRSAELGQIILRPELILNEDGDIGGGGAVLVDISDQLSSGMHHSLAVGPRVVNHHADDNTWEADLMATYGVGLGSMPDPWKHSAGLLGAIGVRDDQSDDAWRLGATAGGWYAYRF
jgi:hypothetical protein